MSRLVEQTTKDYPLTVPRRPERLTHELHVGYRIGGGGKASMMKRNEPNEQMDNARRILRASR